MERSIIYASASSRYLADLIAQRLGLALSKIETKLFKNGEQYYRLGLKERTDLFGRDVIYVASTHTDEDIEELYRVGCALAMYGARRRIFVIPYFGYSTMERAVLPGEIVTAKTIARKLSAIPNTALGNIFLFLDLHVAGLVHYFEGDCLRFELYAEPALELEITYAVKAKNIVFGSADLGRPTWVRAFARIFGTKLVLIDKDREGESSKVHAVIGDVRGKTVIIHDDMLRGGDTLVHAADAYLENGANEAYAVISHASLNSEEVVALIERSPIKKVITTNSHPMSQSAAVKASDKFIVTDVSGIFAEQIKKLLI
jgi:ribose-phosphate pyrophosphokinase